MPRIVVVIIGLLALAVVAFVGLEALSPPDSAPPPRPVDPFHEPPLPGGDNTADPGGLSDPIDVGDSKPMGFGVVVGMVIRADDHAAVPGAQVTLWKGRWRKSVATNQDGLYRMEGTPAGEVRVRVQPKDLVDSPVMTVTVVDGEESPLDFQLEAGTVLTGAVTDETTGSAIADATIRVRGRKQKVAKSGADGTYRLNGLGVGTLVVEAQADEYPVVRHPVPIGAGEDQVTRDFSLLRGGTIEGMVTDGSGAPIEGAKVLIRQARDRSVLSGSDGRFVLNAVPVNASVRIEAEKKGFVPARSEALKLTTSEVARGVVLRLSVGGKVTGKVLLADGSPAVGATVRMMPIRAGTSLVRIPSVKTDATGAFEVSPVAAGDHRLTAVVKGALSATTEVRGVQEGGEVSGVEVRLGAALKISGIVTDFSGDPVPKVFVTARPLNVRAGSRFGSARTDDAGAFEILGLVDGMYKISVRPPRGGPEAASAEVAAGSTEVSLAMPAPGTVSGHVVLANGDPVTSFSVRLLPEAGARAGGTVFRRVNDKSGEFTFTGLTPGTFLISASATGGFSRPLAPISIAAGGEVGGITLVIDAGGRIVGRVVDTSGSALAGASIYARGVEDGMQSTRGGAKTSANGDFEIDSVRPGTYIVTAAKGTLIATAEGVRVESGTEARVDLRMPASGSLTVRVRDAEGWPIAEAVVHVRDAAGRWIAATAAPISTSLPPAERPAAEREARRRAQVTDADGVSTRGGVPEGTVSIRVLARGFADASKTVVVKSGVTTEVVVTMKPGTSGIAGDKFAPERIR